MFIPIYIIIPALYLLIGVMYAWAQLLDLHQRDWHVIRDLVQARTSARMSLAKNDIINLHVKRGRVSAVVFFWPLQLVDDVLKALKGLRRKNHE
jgi:ABC-type microcin C transport system permease subunit YejE